MLLDQSKKSFLLVTSNRITFSYLKKTEFEQIKFLQSVETKNALLIKGVFFYTIKAQLSPNLFGGTCIFLNQISKLRSPEHDMKEKNSSLNCAHNLLVSSLDL